MLPIPSALAPTDRELAWMRHALAMAREAGRLDEVPVAALVVGSGAQGEILGSGVNTRHRSGVVPDPTAHAEVIALREAARTVGDWRLTQATLIVTLEPCIMCAGAILHARIPRVVFACRDPKFGAVRSLYTLLEDERLNHRAEVVEGVLAGESAALLRAFFRARRRGEETLPQPVTE